MAAERSRHELHLYEKEGTLLETILEFYRRALPQGGTAIAVARQANRDALQEHFENSVRVPEVGLRLHDANETLNRFMIGGRPDATRFRQTVGRIIEDAMADGPVAAFGEMVAILWERGEPDAAVELEQLWNALAKTLDFELLCAYSTRGMLDPALKEQLVSVYGQHTHLDAPRAFAKILTV
jgi:hypothetical protein